ncbi:DUF488 family protein [Brevibacillus brevis]|uniref:DUF488 family protein n=1 Tax=Brevibacillus brevis TaxID=1393 RepID=A0ABY9SWF6_BREBE|nr:DUF488 family protein [Brevibacillus brevis]WNC12155.1 DUF488 family protein [Brevibacillus brevis]
MYTIHVKRVYDEPSHTDGKRVLVDRVWPRGISKERAKLTIWMKEVAPSAPLRVWFGHRPERFADFKARYLEELANEALQPSLAQLRDWAAADGITLLYAARDPHCNNAKVLQEYLESGFAPK